MKSIKVAYVQQGFCVFGVGYNAKQAIKDAASWMEHTTPKQAKELLVDQPCHGDMMLVYSEDDRFDSYMEFQGGFVKRGKGWYKA